MSREERMIPDRKPEIQAGNRPVAQTFAPLRTGNRKSRPETDLSHKHLLLYGQETGPDAKTSVADPYPGSGAFLTPGSGIRDLE